MTKRADDYIHGTDTDEQARLAVLNRLSNEAFIEFLDIPDASRVLEVGSGLGLLTNAVARRFPTASVVGLERSDEQLAQASEQIANVEFVLGDAHELPFADGEFEAVYCRYVLEHLTDPLLAAQQMRRVLKPGGRLFVQENDITLCRVDPPSADFDRVWAAFAELQASLGGDARIGAKLFRLLREAGFAEVTLASQAELHWYGCATFESWIGNIIGNVRGAKEALETGGFCSRADTEAAISHLWRLASQPNASATFHWNRAIATVVS